MHVHNVADYAPPGYRLERTDYGDKKCRHTFVKPESPELVCELVAHDAAEEREALEAFRALHTASLPEGVPPFEMPPPWSEAAPSENLVSEAAVRASAATEPPPKPKSKGKR